MVVMVVMVMMVSDIMMDGWNSPPGRKEWSGMWLLVERVSP